MISNSLSSHTSQFIEGNAGTGKTTLAISRLRELLENGVRPQSILVLVPQLALGRPYQLAMTSPDWPSAAGVDVVTIGGLAQRLIEVFWPVISPLAGFANDPVSEPTFLTIETAQYHMAKFVDEAVQTGRFDSVSVPRARIITQSLDNLSKAAINGFSIEEVTQRLTRAWGGHSSRHMVYQTWQEVAQNFRAHCLQHNLLDFSLQTEVFTHQILNTPQSADFLRKKYQHLIADNIEENNPVTLDFIRWLWPGLESALLLYDADAGYRVFLGAEPQGAYELKALCTERRTLPDSVVQSEPIHALEYAVKQAFDRPDAQTPNTSDPRPAIQYEFSRFYPQMLEWVLEQVIDLIHHQRVQPQDIVLIAPFLNDSLRFSITNRFDKAGIPYVSHRPSRAIREEPAARAMLMMMQLVNPAETQLPPPVDLANGLVQLIGGLDPIRARLLTEIVYGVGQSEPSSFDIINPTMQERITYTCGNRYETLRDWLLEQRQHVPSTPPDHFLRSLFGDIASQPGYGFAQNLDAGTVVGQMVESAYGFRTALYPDGTDDWSQLWKDYRSLVSEGLLAASHSLSWHKEESNAVFIAPAYTYLMRNRPVDYQFWIDVGSAAWGERLEQPLTHPYVLRKSYPIDQIWSDEDEQRVSFEMLYKLVLGLVRRCRKQIYLGIADLGEQGFEQRGSLLHLFQYILRPGNEDAA